MKKKRKIKTKPLKSLKILQLIVMDKVRTGGGIQLFRLSKELVKFGHDVTALFSENHEYSEDFSIFEDTGIDLRFLKMERIKLNFRSIRMLRALRDFIKQGDFDIIHVHKGRAATLTWFATFGFDINMISNRGVTTPLTFLRSLKYRWKKIRRIIAVSESVKNVIIETGNVDSKKIDVVYGSVDTEIFKPGVKSTIREEFKIPKQKRIIGFIGNSGKRKGLGYLLEAFQILSEKTNNLVLFLVGVERSALNKFELPPQITSKIITPGFRRDTLNFLSGFNIFAFSGISEEGLTGSVREAASVGLPIITTDVAGNPELIIDGESGLVVPKQDPIALASAMERLLSFPDEARALGIKARETVLSFMTNEYRTKKIESIYFEVLNDSDNLNIDK